MNSNMKKTVLTIMWVLSLCMPLIVLLIITKFFEYDYNNPLENFWIFLLATVVPMISITLGIINHKNEGIINIIIGAIIFIILFLPGLSWLLDGTSDVEYEKVYEYTDIFDIDIPTKGKTLYNEYDGDYYTESKALKVLDIKYEEPYSSELLEKIKNNEKYIYSRNIDKSLIKYFPVTQRVDEKGALLVDDEAVTSYPCYYMIYNKTKDLYNEIVDKKGKYEMYVVRYVPKTSNLSISNYIYIVE